MTNQDLKNKIKELNLLPLYIDKEYFLSNGNSIKEKTTSYTFSVILEKNNSQFKNKYSFQFSFIVFYRNTEFNQVKLKVLGFIKKDEETIDEFVSEDVKTNEALAFDYISKYYDIFASKYNKMILDLLKEDIKKEQEKQKEKERNGEDGAEDEMSSEKLEELLEEMDKESRSGQSENSEDDIDFEDFLDEVGDNNAEPDFTENYQDKELKKSIDGKKEGEGEKSEDGEDDYISDIEKIKLTEDPVYDESLKEFSELTNTKQNDLKRVFGNKSSVDTILQTMSEDEIDTLSRTLNIESGETRAKKINEISKKITQGIQNT